jgi:hypothetical protein
MNLKFILKKLIFKKEGSSPLKTRVDELNMHDGAAFSLSLVTKKDNFAFMMNFFKIKSRK